MANNQPYILIEQKTGFSKYGGTLITLTMIGVNDRKEYKTYLDPRNHNFKHWQHITMNPKHGFVIRSLRIKNADKCILNADSAPIIEWEHDNPEVILAQLEEIWKEQDRTEPPSTFRELFE